MRLHHLLHTKRSELMTSNSVNLLVRKIGYESDSGENYPAAHTQTWKHETQSTPRDLQGGAGVKRPPRVKPLVPLTPESHESNARSKMEHLSNLAVVSWISTCSIRLNSGDTVPCPLWALAPESRFTPFSIASQLIFGKIISHPILPRVHSLH